MGVTKILQENEITPFFEILKANIIRSRTSMTIILLKVSIGILTNIDYSTLNKHLTNFLQSKLRNTDLLFELAEELEWGILLTNSGEEEAKALVERLFQLLKQEKITDEFLLALQVMIAEIRNNNATFGDILTKKIININENPNPWHITIIEHYKIPPIENVKISILEENMIFREILERTLQNMTMKHVQFDICTFKDGYEFLESNWYLSGHVHVIIMNDILPRKNGIEVLHKIRNMPNQKKFIIFMMTTRNSQTDMINAYEAGVDAYLIKPFDLRLFEAELRRTFARLWN